MTDIKLSALPEALSGALSSTDTVAAVVAGVTSKVTLASLTTKVGALGSFGTGTALDAGLSLVKTTSTQGTPIRLSIQADQTVGATQSAEIQIIPSPSVDQAAMNAQIMLFGKTGTDYSRFSMSQINSQIVIDSTANFNGLIRAAAFVMGGFESYQATGKPRAGQNAMILVSDASVRLRGSTQTVAVTGGEAGGTYGVERTTIYDFGDTGSSRLIIGTRQIGNTSVAADSAGVEYQRGNSVKWLVGLNMGGTNTDSFDWYSSGATRLKLSAAGTLTATAFVGDGSGLTGVAAGSFAGGNISNAVKLWTSGGASTRALDTPALRVVDTTGTAFRSFSVFGDEAIAQVGPTPGAVQWQSGSSGAPVGSGGPVIPIAPVGGVHLYNGPTSGDTALVMVANADVAGASATAGPNQQTGIGMSSSASTGRIRINTITARSDGGWQIATNRYSAKQATGVGNASLTGSTVTFSSSQTGRIGIGDAFWVTMPAGAYSDGSLNVGSPSTQGFTLFTLSVDGLTATYTPIQNIGTPFTAAILYITASPQGDTNRGSVKMGSDSASDFIGFQYQQPGASTHTPANHIGDYNLLVYPGGIIGRPNTGTDAFGFTSYTDIVVKQPSRSLRFGTSGDVTNGDYIAALTIAFHYASDAAGTILAHGQLRAQGGSNGSRSSFHMQTQSTPSSWVGGGIDLWSDGTSLFYRTAAGVTKTVTVT